MGRDESPGKRLRREGPACPWDCLRAGQQAALGPLGGAEVLPAPPAVTGTVDPDTQATALPITDPTTATPTDLG